MRETYRRLKATGFQYLSSSIFPLILVIQLLVPPTGVASEVVWEQVPYMAGPAFNSQRDAFICANDFPIEDARHIVAVEWWGSYWSGRDPSDFGGFWIRFYVGGLAVPIYEEYVPGYANETFYGYNEYYGTDVYEYHADLPTPFDPYPGATHWLSIQMDLAPNGADAWWGWASSTEPYDPWGSWAMQRIVWETGWESKSYDTAFRLIASNPRGDVNGDGSVDPGDIEGFVAVLLGLDTDPGRRAAADVDGSGAADGNDVQPFLTAVLGP